MGPPGGRALRRSARRWPHLHDAPRLALAALLLVPARGSQPRAPPPTRRPVPLAAVARREEQAAVAVWASRLLLKEAADLVAAARLSCPTRAGDAKAKLRPDGGCRAAHGGSPAWLGGGAHSMWNRVLAALATSSNDFSLLSLFYPQMLMWLSYGE